MGMRKICLLIWALGLSLVGVQAQAKGKKREEIKKNVVKNRLVEKVKEPKFNTILANYGRGGGYNQGGRRGGYNQGGRRGGYNQGGRRGGYNQGGRRGGYNQGGRRGGYNQGGRRGSYNRGGRRGIF